MNCPFKNFTSEEYFATNLTRLHWLRVRWMGIGNVSDIYTILNVGHEIADEH